MGGRRCSPRLVCQIVFILALAPLAVQGEDSAADIFQRRILPIARSQQASSCTECHFGGVQLQKYVLDDQASTFAALREAGLIDVEAPDASKLLTFIRRRPEREDALLAKVRAQELAAFQAWIGAAVRDPALRNASAPTGAAASIGGGVPAEVIRHARHDRVLRSFVENVWIEIERCVNCHSPQRNQRLVGEHGEHISWISPDDPAGTLAICLDHELINLEAPDKSPLLQKPLGEVKHGGHIKFAPGSAADKQFRRFLDDFAAVSRGEYRVAADLPRETTTVRIATGQHLRITDLPEWAGGRLMRVDLHRWTDSGWSERPVGSADSRVNKDNLLWQNLVYGVVPRERASQRDLLTTRQLPEARYLARLYIDREGTLEQDRDRELGAAELYRELEFHGPWPPGWQQPKILTAKDR